jgi:hypothetical protein
VAPSPMRTRPDVRPTGKHPYMPKPPRAALPRYTSAL